MRIAMVMAPAAIAPKIHRERGRARVVCPQRTKEREGVLFWNINIPNPKSSRRGITRWVAMPVNVLANA